MNQLYKSLFAVSVVAGAAFTAQADDTFKVNLMINDASKVKVQVNWNDYDAESGLNVIELSGWTTISFQPTDGNVIKSISGKDVGSGSVKDRTENWVFNTEFWYVDDNSTVTEYTIQVFATSIADAATGSFTLTTDDASKTHYQLAPKSMPYGYAQELETGSNTIKYIPGAMTTLYVQPAGYSNPPLYEVKLNGKVLSSDGGTQYTVGISQGMNVDVVTKYPDQDVKVDFAFEKEGKDAIEYVKINDEEVSGWESGSLTCKLGSRIEVRGNTTEYDNINITWNGNDRYSNLSEFVLAPATVTVTADKRPTFEVTVDVDDASHVEFWKGFSGGGVLVPLKDGANPGITVPTSEETDWDTPGYPRFTCARVTIVPTDGYTIDEVLLNGVAQAKGSDNSYPVNMLDEKNTIVIKTSKIIRDQTFVVYVQNMDSWRNLSIMGPGWSKLMTLEQGYNEATRAAFEIETVYLSGSFNGSTDDAAVYLNDNKLPPLGRWGMDYTFSAESEYGEITNGSILKIYSEVPESCDVTFDVNEDVEGLFTVSRDIITTVNPNDVLSCLSGTRITITSTQSLSVKVNGVVVEAEAPQGEVATQADGEYTYIFTVNGNDKVEIEKSILDGVETINSDKAANEVYNLQGIRVNSTNIPAGVYIINGKKVVIK